MTSKETYLLAEALFIRAWANDPKAEPYTLAQKSVEDHQAKENEPPKATKPAKEKRSASKRKAA